MKINYKQVGDYQIPDVEMPKQKSIGLYGQLRLTYLKTHRNVFYQKLLLSGELNEHLFKIDTAARKFIADFIRDAEENAPDKAITRKAPIKRLRQPSNPKAIQGSC